MLDEAIEGAALVCNRLPTEHLQLLPKDRVTLQQGMTPSQDSEWAPGVIYPLSGVQAAPSSWKSCVFLIAHLFR